MTGNPSSVKGTLAGLQFWVACFLAVGYLLEASSESRSFPKLPANEVLCEEEAA